MCGNLSGATNQSQAVIHRLSQIENPSAAFVFVDESANTIDDAHFYLYPFPDNRWVNLPTDRHRQGGTFSFADGHVEHWKWRHPKQRPRGPDRHIATRNDDLADLRRLQQVIPVTTNTLSHP